ncbi:unnamed protein product [Orchesella dallaii]|uniref:Uncharacterized protein n=1 Tax=Orchesella dallaii TaxID=48710 RepID=A0ABP1QBS7_9HEXA
MNFNAAASNICNGGGDGDAMDELISAAITATKPHVEVPVPVSTLPKLKAPITIYDQERTKILKNLKKAMASLDEFHNRFKQGFKQNTNAWKCYMESLNWQMILINPNEDDNSSNSNKKKVLLEQQFSFYSKKMDDALKMKLGLMNRANNLSTKILDRFKLTTGALEVLATLPREGANLSEEEMFAALATLEHNENSIET